jgi:hypothetical protein
VPLNQGLSEPGQVQGGFPRHIVPVRRNRVFKCRDGAQGTLQLGPYPALHNLDLVAVEPVHPDRVFVRLAFIERVVDLVEGLPGRVRRGGAGVRPRDPFEQQRPGGGGRLDLRTFVRRAGQQYRFAWIADVSDLVSEAGQVVGCTGCVVRGACAGEETSICQDPPGVVTCRTPPAPP